MAKLSTFLIIVVLIARGVLFVYDKNKSKFEKFVTQEKAPTEEVTTMNLNEPVSSGTNGTAASPTVTFILTDNDEIYYYTGTFKYILQKIDNDKVSNLIKKYKEITNADDLMFVIKPTDKSSYKSTLDLLDAMSVNDISASHYDEAKATEDEMRIIKIYKGK